MTIINNLRRRIRLSWIYTRFFFRFSRRHHRYGVIAIGLTLRAWIQPKTAEALRSGFCYLQYIDDILDHDWPTDESPLVITDRLIRQLKDRTPAQDDVERLAESFSTQLLSRYPDEQPIERTVDLIQCMRADHHRMLNCERWPAERLAAHHRSTFSLSFDLFLMAAQSSCRAADMSHLMEAMGWCSTMRDLEDDLEKGLINIPAEVLAHLDPLPATSPLVLDPKVARWIQTAYAEATAQLESAAEEGLRLGDKTGRRIHRMFHRSVHGFAQKLPRVYPCLNDIVSTAQSESQPPR